MQLNMRIRKPRQPGSFRRIVALGLALAGTVLVQLRRIKRGQARSRPAGRHSSSVSHKPVASLSPYVDVHTHLDETNVAGSMQSAIESMPSENLVKIIFMPSPFTLADANRFDVERLAPAAKKYPGKINLLAGASPLNPILIVPPPPRHP